MHSEDNKTEYKSVLNDKFERVVVGFLNCKDGGDIYIGIEDDGNVVGIEDSDIMQLRVMDRIKNNILPVTLGLFDVVLEKIQGKNIIHIIVSSGLEKPYYIKSQGMSPAGCYIRIGSSTQPMTTNMIEELYSKRIRNSLGKILSPRSDLTFEQLQIYYQGKGLKLNDNFEKNLELVTDNGKYNYTGYLLADNNGVSIKVAKYSGKDKVDLIENEEYGYCSLIKATKSVIDKLEIENKTMTQITGKERLEKRLVDAVALREAVINAVVHNDYTQENPPVFEIFSDRIVITSYGGLVPGLDKEEFFNCRSMPRNRELMRVFKDVGLVEQLGSGMSRILNLYDKTIFDFSSHFLTVTFYFKDAFNRCTEKYTEKYTVKLNETQREILSLISENKDITQKVLADKLKLNRRTIAKNIKQLKELGVLERIGADKGGVWKVKG